MISACPCTQTSSMCVSVTSSKRKKVASGAMISTGKLIVGVPQCHRFIKYRTVPIGTAGARKAMSMNESKK